MWKLRDIYHHSQHFDVGNIMDHRDDIVVIGVVYVRPKVWEFICRLRVFWSPRMLKEGDGKRTLWGKWRQTPSLMFSMDPMFDHISFMLLLLLQSSTSAAHRTTCGNSCCKLGAKAFAPVTTSSSTSTTMAPASKAPPSPTTGARGIEVTPMTTGPGRRLR